MATNLRTENKSLYAAWVSMKTRCYNPKYNQFHRYGGRGIKICDKWDKFAGFHEDMASTHKPGLSLDRIDNNGDYDPSNCRWATPKEQAQNTSRNRLFEYEGVIDILPNWARFFNIKRSTLSQRIYVYKWSLEEALFPERRVRSHSN